MNDIANSVVHYAKTCIFKVLLFSQFKKNDYLYRCKTKEINKNLKVDKIMKKMTLGEFRKLTEHMSDDAVICMSIDRNGEWIHPSAKYIVTYAEVEKYKATVGIPAEVVLGHKVRDLED